MRIISISCFELYKCQFHCFIAFYSVTAVKTLESLSNFKRIFALNFSNQFFVSIAATGSPET